MNARLIVLFGIIVGVAAAAVLHPEIGQMIGLGN